MCLDTIDKKTKRGRGYGYKAFGIEDGKLVPNMLHLRSDWNYPEEVWFTDPATGGIASFMTIETYRKGFHICKSKEHAHKWDGETTRKVFYRDITASGLFARRTVVVARQIWITKEEI